MKLFSTKFALILVCVLAWMFLMAKSAIAADQVQYSQISYQDTRTIKLARFFQRYNSPMADYAADFVAQADKNGLDYRLLPAISGVESTFGRNYMPGSFNTYGWGGGHIYFSSWQDGIAKISKGLKENYVDKGATDVEAISWIYCPPGNLTWAAKVRYFMNLIEQTDYTLPKESPLLALALTL